MYVQQLMWKTSSKQQANTLALLSGLHHHMDSSGGLIRCLVGSQGNSPDVLYSLSFWKSWEDLSRFLSSEKSSYLTLSALSNATERMQPKHYEVIWEFADDEINKLPGETFWAISDYQCQPKQEHVLLDALRHRCQALEQESVFAGASLWIDKNDPQHIAVATLWQGNSQGEEKANEMARNLGRGNLPVTEFSSFVIKALIAKPHHLEHV
jgi:heme-degrading monooxygenase HmoA